MPKGRDKTLIELRDEALLRRYYYWTEVQRLRFDDALRILSRQEFFISEERIMAIIRRKCDMLKEIALKPVPKVKKPRLTAVQLSLLRVTDTPKELIGFSALHGRLVVYGERESRFVDLYIPRQRIIPAFHPLKRAGVFGTPELLERTVQQGSHLLAFTYFFIRSGGVMRVVVTVDSQAYDDHRLAFCAPIPRSFQSESAYPIRTAGKVTG